jgi:hypothetical protein
MFRLRNIPDTNHSDIGIPPVTRNVRPVRHALVIEREWKGCVAVRRCTAAISGASAAHGLLRRIFERAPMQFLTSESHVPRLLPGWPKTLSKTRHWVDLAPVRGCSPGSARSVNRDLFLVRPLLDTFSRAPGPLYTDVC